MTKFKMYRRDTWPTRVFDGFKLSNLLSLPLILPPQMHASYLPISCGPTGIPGDGRCLFRSAAHGACLCSGQSTPDEVLQRQLADELREKVLFLFLLAAVSFFIIVTTEMLQACSLFYLLYNRLQFS